MKKFIFFSFALLLFTGAQAKITAAGDTIKNDGTGMTYGTQTGQYSYHSSDTIAFNPDTIWDITAVSSTADPVLHVSAMYEVTVIDTFTQVYIPIDIDEDVTSAVFADFQRIEMSNKSNIVKINKQYQRRPAPYINLCELARLHSDQVKVWSELENDDQRGTCYYYLYEYDDEEGWGYNRYSVKAGEDQLTVFRSKDGLATETYYWTRPNNAGTANLYYSLPIVEQNFTITQRPCVVYNAIVTTLPYRCPVADNLNIQSVTIGKSIVNIAPGAFIGAKNLSLYIVEAGNTKYVYENGILYVVDGEGTKVSIISASCDVQSQTIPTSVERIEMYAFANVKNPITITSLNPDLEVAQGNEIVTVLKPSELTFTQTAQGGYIYSGRALRSTIESLTIQGTYMDLTNVDVLEDNINITNNTNTLIYFATDKTVAGTNVINNGVCDECVILDNGTTYYCPADFSANNLTYTRTLAWDSCRWYSMCVPFTVSNEDLDDALLIGRFDSYNQRWTTYDFIYTDVIKANTPYIVKVKDEYAKSFTFENIKNATVKATNLQPVVKELNTQFIGVFSPITLRSSELSGYNYIGLTNRWSEFYQEYVSEFVILEDVLVNTFRAYLIGLDLQQQNSVKIRLLDAMDNVIAEDELPVTSGVKEVEAIEEKEEAIYNLNGQRINEATRGLNIVNGNVIINK